MRTVFQYFGLMMVVFYITLGLAMMGGSNKFFHIPDQYALPAGLMLTICGTYRAYRIYQKYRDQ